MASHCEERKMSDSIDAQTKAARTTTTTTSTSGNDRLDRYLQSVRELEHVSTGGTIRESNVKSERVEETKR